MRDVIIVLQITSIVLLFYATVYIAAQRPSHMQTLLLMLTVSTGIMMIGYLVEICPAFFCINNTISEQDISYLGAILSYFGKPFVLLLSLLFELEYCGIRIPKKITLPLCLLHSCFTLAVITNTKHHLFYATVSFDLDAPFSSLVTTRGPLYYVYMVLIFSYFVISIVTLIHEIITCKTKKARLQTFYVVGMNVFGVGGFVMYLFNVIDGYDATMGGCTIGTMFLLGLFFRFRIFDFLSFAQEQALDDSQDGLLVMDTRGRTLYTNVVARKLLAGPISPEVIRNMSDGTTKITVGDFVYSLKKRDAVNRGRLLGKVIEMADITEDAHYAERLEQDIAARTAEIQHIQRSVITSFADIVEARNDETGDHIRRTSSYVGLIAKSMKEKGMYPDVLTDEFINRLIDTAPLHDIGKVSVPDNILLKPGKLTDEEFTEMKKHAERGGEIIEKTLRGVESDEFVSMAENMAHYHHEKWNGSGYPDGKQGRQIPLSARIMAVADVYDAIVSKRCYKNAMSKEEARKIIEDSSGSHFDPDVVDAFMANITRIEAV